MFRVPSRPTYAGTTAPPRLAYGSRRRMVGVMYGRNGWQSDGRGPSPFTSSPVTDGLALRAPWGELEHGILSVTITTQLFPLAWWTAPGLRTTAAAARARDVPLDLVEGLVRIPIEPSSETFRVSLPEPEVEVPVAALSLNNQPQAGAARAAASERGDAQPRATRRAHGRSAQQRRGFAARMAVLAIGLIISLIAVETASRRRP